MRPIVYIPRFIAKEGVDFLLERGFAVREGSGIDEDTLCREVRGCQSILVRTAHITRKVLQAEPQLRLVVRHGTGMDIIDVEAASRLGIQVANTPQSNGPAVAELCVGGMLAAARKLPSLCSSARRGDFFYKNHCTGAELRGKRLGLVGLGDIGLRTARIAALGFQMEVAAYRGHTQGKAIPDYVRLLEWDELFRTSDFISLHIPLRPENMGLVGRREFEMMKPTAILVNTSRGQVVQEQELIQALEQNRLAGAFLDVLSEEPFPKDNPLLHMEQVIVSPHIGSNTSDALIRSALQAAEEVDRFFHGQPLRWPVNSLQHTVK